MHIAQLSLSKPLCVLQSYALVCSTTSFSGSDNLSLIQLTTFLSGEIKFSLFD